MVTGDHVFKDSPPGTQLIENMSPGQEDWPFSGGSRGGPGTPGRRLIASIKQEYKRPRRTAQHDNPDDWPRSRARRGERDRLRATPSSPTARRTTGGRAIERSPPASSSRHGFPPLGYPDAAAD